MSNVYLAVQEHNNDGPKLLSLALSISLADPTSTIVMHCSDDVRDFIVNYTDINASIEFNTIDEQFNLENYAKRWLNALQVNIDSQRPVIFCHQMLVFSSPVIITDEIKAQGIGFIKKHIGVAPSHERSLYSFDVLYISSQAVLDKIKKHYESDSTLFVDGKTEWSDSEKKNLIECWANLPLRFADYDDGTVCVSEYIDGRGYLGTENFFAFENAWKMSELDYQGDVLKRGEDTIFVTNIRFDTLERAVQELNKRLLNMVVQTNRHLMPIYNIKFSNDGIQQIGVPKPGGLLHWKRDVDSWFYKFIDELCQSDTFKRVEVEADYFICNNRILLDFPGTKWINNSVSKAFSVLYFAYDEQLLSVIPDMGPDFVFGGYVPRNRAVLECVDMVERDEDVILIPPRHEITDNDYPAFLENLRRHRYARFTIDSDKSMAAECAYLGVVPMVDEDVSLIDLDQLSTSSWSEQSVEVINYYNTQLTIDTMKRKLLDHILS
jgi:hypothetical protein